MSRNLLEYPITKDEVLKTIEEATRRAFNPKAIGGQELYIMKRVSELVAFGFCHADFNP